MSLSLSNLADLVGILAWAALWSLGGMWLTQKAFTLSRREQALVGLGVGLAAQLWLANLLGHVLLLPAASWVSAAAVFLCGLLASSPWKPGRLLTLVRLPILPVQWIGFLLLAMVLTQLGLGLAILDDYQNLPMTSMIAAGDIPPRFALDPAVVFDYHYTTLLFAAQIMRIGGLFPWNSLDVARGLVFALAIFLGALWVQRVTRSAIAGWISAMVGVFATGTRWLLLLLPVSLLKRIAPDIELIGSGLGSVPQQVVAMTGDPPFFAALTNAWGIESGATWEFPFAFANGILPASIWSFHSGAGALGSVIGGILLLTHNRWRSAWSWGIVTVLLATFAQIAEPAFVRLGIGVVIIAALVAVRQRSFRIPRSLWQWLAVLIPAGLIAAVQGGVLTGIASGFIDRLLGGVGESGGYFTFGFSLYWPPAVLSSHLGYLTPFNINQLLVAAFETGPIILFLPLALYWGFRAWRTRRWYEAALFVMPLLAVLTFVVQYTGSAGPTALNRVQSMLLGLAVGNFAVATLWMWVRRRSDTIKLLTASVLFISMLGGFILFGLQLLSVPRSVPNFSTFIDPLDARMTKAYWNHLEQDALIFDPIPSRAPTIFGRPTDSNITWYVRKPAWEALSERPALVDLRAAGFTHVYLDFNYWQELTPEIQQQFSDPCVELIQEYRMPDPENLTRETFRRLLNIRACGQ
ncbi:MAG: hypothetical protein U1B80_07605 [Anaerolineaceae bacterium]|nr:hypothetical protein [Anaerolineaceae bacterium]